MTAPYGTLIAANLASVTAVAVAIALDPTVQVALIVAVPTTIVGVGTLLLGYLNYKAGILHSQVLQEVKTDVNSNFSRMLDEKAKQTDQLEQKSTKLSDVQTELGRAQGRREGVEATKQAAIDLHKEGNGV